MRKDMSLKFAAGSDCNPGRVDATTELFGDTKRKPEKPYTIVLFPGGSVEISRCTDGTYWVHVATKREHGQPNGRIVNARIDAAQRYCDESNAMLRAEIEKGDVKHIAFLIALEEPK